ncbi:clavesin-1-like [Culex pipiens pallens]|uniref:clavesin-1-like n=1 Tax=Culex pipiens pallens TaxID=42434 RepID=UPI001952A6FB|nr:clavesin-1-like [Culex pipiens pallens]
MALVPSVEKKPATYDEFQTTLEPKYLDQARIELNEEDYRREPAIARMREFIAKHPRIQRCRTDAIFLLRFLRYKKFNVDLDNPMIERCTCVPLGQNSDGSLVCLIRLGSFDPDTFEPEQIVRLCTLTVDMYAYEEVYQVTGFTVVVDLHGMTMGHVGAMTLTKIKIMTNAMNNILGARIKRIHLIQLPKIAGTVVTIFSKALSSKLQRRIKISKQSY